MTAKKPKKENKIKELTETVQRLQADFENYKKRTEKEKQEFVKYACQNIVLDLLPILDNFELALQHTKNQEEFVKGIELVYANFIDVLEKKGLKQINSINKEFNPVIHEALMQETSKESPGTIIEEFQKGYMINDKVIRPTKVKVAKR
jgi:molecular chaperone GrpE